MILFKADYISQESSIIQGCTKCLRLVWYLRRMENIFLLIWIVYDAQTTLEKVVEAYWKLKAVDALEMSAERIRKDN
jgi:hypothetical protein